MGDRPFVEVSIHGHTFRVRAEGGEQALRDAAALAEETLERIRGRSGTVDTAEVALRACLSLAVQLIAAREPTPGFGVLDDQRVEDLISTLESALGADAPAAT